MALSKFQLAQRRWGWRLYHFFGWIDHQWWRYGPSTWMENLMYAMERRGICCSRHEKED